MFLCRPFSRASSSIGTPPAWQMARNQHPVPRPRLTYHRMKKRGLEHRALQVQPGRRRKTFSAANQGCQQRHPRPLPWLSSATSCRDGRPGLLRAASSPPARLSPRTIRSTPAATRGNSSALPRPLHPREGLVRQHNGLLRRPTPGSPPAVRRFPSNRMVAGNFVNAGEKAGVRPHLRHARGPQHRSLSGLCFLGDQKEQALREADLFCFPTYYQNENQPVNLIEAMAYGLPILTTRWRSCPNSSPPVTAASWTSVRRNKSPRRSWPA